HQRDRHDHRRLLAGEPVREGRPATCRSALRSTAPQAARAPATPATGKDGGGANDGDPYPAEEGRGWDSDHCRSPRPPRRAPVLPNPFWTSHVLPTRTPVTVSAHGREE